MVLPPPARTLEKAFKDMKLTREEREKVKELARDFEIRVIDPSDMSHWPAFICKADGKPLTEAELAEFVKSFPKIVGL